MHLPASNSRHPRQPHHDAVPRVLVLEILLLPVGYADLVAAVTVLAEIGDLSRFQNPRELMGYLGLVPSENSTGDTVNRGGITKAGKGRARRILVEAAWSYRHPPRVKAQAAPIARPKVPMRWGGADCLVVALKRRNGRGAKGAGHRHWGWVSNGRSPTINERRQPSCGGTSRMLREYHVRICEGLRVKFPGPTRHQQTFDRTSRASS